MANKLGTPPNRIVSNFLDLQTNTRWIGQYPPANWPLDKFSLTQRLGDSSASILTSMTAPDPPIFNAPVYFVNLKQRPLVSIKAYGDAIESSGEEKLCGFDFMFADGSTEPVGAQKENSVFSNKDMRISFQENEVITDVVLCFRDSSLQTWCGLKVCPVILDKRAFRVLKC